MYPTTPFLHVYAMITVWSHLAHLNLAATLCARIPALQQADLATPRPSVGRLCAWQKAYACWVLTCMLSLLSLQTRIFQLHVMRPCAVPNDSSFAHRSSRPSRANVGNASQFPTEPTPTCPNLLCVMQLPPVFFFLTASSSSVPSMKKKCCLQIMIVPSLLSSTHLPLASCRFFASTTFGAYRSLPLPPSLPRPNLIRSSFLTVEIFQKAFRTYFESCCCPVFLFDRIF